MDGILLDPLQVKNAAGTTIDPATQSLQETLNELVSRLDTLAACKHHLTEAMRVQIVGAVTTTVFTYDLTSPAYMTPAYQRYLPTVHAGNLNAEIANIQNVTI